MLIRLLKSNSHIGLSTSKSAFPLSPCAFKYSGSMSLVSFYRILSTYKGDKNLRAL